MNVGTHKGGSIKERLYRCEFIPKEEAKLDECFPIFEQGKGFERLQLAIFMLLEYGCQL